MARLKAQTQCVKIGVKKAQCTAVHTVHWYSVPGAPGAHRALAQCTAVHLVRSQTLTVHTTTGHLHVASN